MLSGNNNRTKSDPALAKRKKDEAESSEAKETPSESPQVIAASPPKRTLRFLQRSLPSRARIPVTRRQQSVESVRAQFLAQIPDKLLAQLVTTLPDALLTRVYMLEHKVRGRSTADELLQSHLVSSTNNVFAAKTLTDAAETRLCAMMRVLSMIHLRNREGYVQSIYKNTDGSEINVPAIVVNLLEQYPELLVNTFTLSPNALMRVCCMNHKIMKHVFLREEKVYGNTTQKSFDGVFRLENGNIAAPLEKMPEGKYAYVVVPVEVAPALSGSNAIFVLELRVARAKTNCHRWLVDAENYDNFRGFVSECNSVGKALDVPDYRKIIYKGKPLIAGGGEFIVDDTGQVVFVTNSTGHLRDIPHRQQYDCIFSFLRNVSRDSYYNYDGDKNALHQELNKRGLGRYIERDPDAVTQTPPSSSSSVLFRPETPDLNAGSGMDVSPKGPALNLAQRE